MKYSKTFFPVKKDLLSAKIHKVCKICKIIQNLHIYFLKIFSHVEMKGFEKNSIIHCYMIKNLIISKLKRSFEIIDYNDKNEELPSFKIKLWSLYILQIDQVF